MSEQKLIENSDKNCSTSKCPFKKRKCLFGTIFVLIIFSALAYIILLQTYTYEKVSNITISDKKMDYVYKNIGNLVNILDDKQAIEFSADEKYDFKPVDQQVITPETTAETSNNTTLKEELVKLSDDKKIKLVRDRLIDIYQKSKDRDEALEAVKQSFYQTKVLIEQWYSNGAKQPVPQIIANDNFIDRVKNNLGEFVQVNKIDSTTKDGKILSPDKVPGMLSQAEILLEAGSLSQVVWIMEDIQTISKLEDIFTFTAKAEVYLEKNPNPKADIQQIKDLIELIENSNN
jgi:hypothetical protein